MTMNGREMVMLGSNNYLGLTSHPEGQGGRDRRRQEVRRGLRREPPPERHARHPRPARGAPRGVHGEAGLRHVLDRVLREPRRPLHDRPEGRHDLPRPAGPRLHLRRRAPRHRRERPEVPAQRPGRPPPPPRPLGRPARADSRGGRRLLDGRGHRPAPRVRRRLRRVGHGVHGGRRSRHRRPRQARPGHRRALRPRGPGRPDHGDVLEVAGHGRRLRRRRRRTSSSTSSTGPGRIMFTAAPPPASVAAALAARRHHRGGARAPRAALGEHPLHDDGPARAWASTAASRSTPVIPDRRRRGRQRLQDGDAAAGRGRLRERRRQPGHAAGAGPDPHLLHGDAHEGTPDARPRGVRQGGPRARSYSNSAGRSRVAPVGVRGRPQGVRRAAVPPLPWRRELGASAARATSARCSTRRRTRSGSTPSGSSFLARRDGRVVGRIAAIADDEHNRVHERPDGVLRLLRVRERREAAARLSSRPPRRPRRALLPGARPAPRPGESVDERGGGRARPRRRASPAFRS